MSDLQLWALVAGFFLPPVQAFIQQSHWSNVLRSLVNFACCLLVGAGVAYFSGALTGRRWVESSLLVLVAAIATYHGTWKPSMIAPTLEAATTFRSRART